MGFSSDWLVGEVTGQFSRNIVLSLKLPSSTFLHLGEGLGSTEDVVMHIP